MNATNTLTRPGPSDVRPEDARWPEQETPDRAAPAGDGRTGGHGDDDHGSTGRTAERTGRTRDTDGMAVASFVLGLTGLLVFNVVLGPIALVLGGLALLRGTERRGRALFGTALGVADLLVLAAVVAADGTVSWSIAG